MTLVPGFVDAHYHCESSRVSARRHAEVTLPQGLTAYFEGTHEITNAARGLPGVEYFVEAAARLPQKIYPCVSSATPPSPVETTSGYIGYAETVPAFERWPEEARGIDEVMDLPRVLDGSARLHGVIQATLDDRRVVAGHGSPPLEVLDGWIAAGIMSSHSPRVAEALTMLRKGVHLQLKTERTAEIIRQFLALPLRDWRNVGLAVDDRTVADLLDRGGIDYEVRTAIALGVPADHGLPDGHHQQRRALAGVAPPRPARARTLRGRAARVGPRAGRHRSRLRERPRSSPNADA